MSEPYVDTIWDEPADDDEPEPEEPEPDDPDTDAPGGLAAICASGAADAS